MKKYRILAGIVTAALSAAVFTAPFDAVNTASASNSSIPATSRIKDLNRDNVLDTSDAQYLLTFLNGKVDYPYDYADMDANADSIVDSLDSEAYLRYYTYYQVMQSTTPPFSAHGAAHTTDTTSELDYKVYNAQTGAYSHTYALYELPMQRSSRAIIGTDEREIDWSKSGVVQIVTTDGAYNYWSTGFVVSEHIIATAAHCFFDEETGNFTEVSSIRLYNTSGNITLQPTSLEVHIPQAYLDVNTPGANYVPVADYALVTVEEDLSDYMCFNLAVPLNSASSQDHSLVTTGFPWDNLETMVSGEGEIGGLTADRLLHTCDAVQSESGGPIYIGDSSITQSNEEFYSVIGIHVCEPRVENPQYNVGMRMTLDMLHFFLSNDDINSPTE